MFDSHNGSNPMPAASTPDTADRRRPLFDALSLARYVRRHREQRQLSVAMAAGLAGIDAIDWYAVEGGWLPADFDHRLRAMADALQVGWEQLSFGATLTRAAAERDAA